LKAVSIGELAVDWLSLEAGKTMMSASRFYRHIGGNATNVAVGLARLGIDSALVSKVGLDFHGDYLLASLGQEGVDTQWVVKDPDEPTAQCYMTRQSDGSCFYQAWPARNASKSLLPGDITAEAFNESWIWHAAAPTFIARPRRSAMTYAMQQAREKNKIISFDAGFPLVESGGGRQAAWEAMQLADILKFNLKEASYWAGISTDTGLDAIAARLLEKLQPQLMVITLAEKGAVLYSAGKSAFCRPFQVETIGDVGAGDAFSAGLIFGLFRLHEAHLDRRCLEKLDLDAWQQAAAYGSCAGALVTRAISATESFPRRDELMLAMGKVPSRSPEN
jgi:sugar/nucleoside kinase (ribokinase family)